MYSKFTGGKKATSVSYIGSVQDAIEREAQITLQTFRIL